ncbi:UPF0236 family transposase-like protein [Spiroplasma endosymbiont of Polydrusus pterygomalis]|uniref:UPF0236 family transposase-like protein n=1 Tax=Spiroplasma endosymbiont of Polydrusus pterygomalis TaxID=3139327 RepID=UPI003CCAF5C3
MLDEPDTKLKHDGVIYIETDEAYRNAISYQIKKRLKIKKRIRLTVFHTGYKDPKTIRKTMHNFKFLVTMTNEVKKINSKKYWQGIKEFINLNYESPETAKIIVLGDGAQYISTVEKHINVEFIIDRFHVIKKIKDCLRGPRYYKRYLFNKIRKAILKLNWNKVTKYLEWAYQLVKTEEAKGKLQEISNYLRTYYGAIQKWEYQENIGCRIESYIARIIKLMFRSKPKIFNEKTIYKVMLLKQLTANGINPFQELTEIKNLQVKNEQITWRWIFKKMNNPEVKQYNLPIFTASTLSNTKTLLKKIVYNYY